MSNKIDEKLKSLVDETELSENDIPFLKYFCDELFFPNIHRIDFFN